jgi:hypothetical protein
MDTSQQRKLEVSQKYRRPESITIKDEVKMCKERLQQKNEPCEQLTFFGKDGEPVLDSAGGTCRIRETGVELSSRLEQQRTLTQNILEKIVDYGNLNRAYRQVESNHGSSGVDKMEVEELREWLGGHLRELHASLLKETYEAGAVRKIEIPKPEGGTRILGIPTVKDRLIQQAIHQELNRYYDPYFSE